MNITDTPTTSGPAVVIEKTRSVAYTTTVLAAVLAARQELELQLLRALIAQAVRRDSRVYV